LLEDAFERFVIGVIVKERHATAGSIQSVIDITAVGCEITSLFLCRRRLSPSA
jgi:hypothetical protein